MSAITMNKKLVSLFASFAALPMLVACGNSTAQPPLEKGPIYGATIGGSYTLTDQNGKQRANSEFTGKWRIVYFGYTSCPDICTPDMQNLMGGLKLYAAQNEKLAEKIQPVFITVDPKRDTPEILKKFVRAFHPRLIGLTGSEEEIAEVAKKFAVQYNIVEQDNGYLVGHSQIPYLMDPEGRPIAILPADRPDTDINEGRPEEVANELAKWVR